MKSSLPSSSGCTYIVTMSPNCARLSNVGLPLTPRRIVWPCSFTSENRLLAYARFAWRRSIGVNETTPGGVTPSDVRTPSDASSLLNSSIRRSSTGSRSRRALRPPSVSPRIFWMARATIRAASIRLSGLVFSSVRSASPAVTRRSRSS